MAVGSDTHPTRGDLETALRALHNAVRCATKKRLVLFAKPCLWFYFCLLTAAFVAFGRQRKQRPVDAVFCHSTGQLEIPTVL